MKASKKLIKFYKGCILTPIHNKLKADGVDMPIESVDSYIKAKAQIDMSCIQMTTEQLAEVIEMGKTFGDEIGLNLNYRKDELDLIVKIFE